MLLHDDNPVRRCERVEAVVYDDVKLKRNTAWVIQRHLTLIRGDETLADGSDVLLHVFIRQELELAAVIDL